MPHRLEQKVVVVIGGTTGIGLSAARAFLAEGARVVAVGRNPANAEAAQQLLGDRAYVFSADAIDPNTARTAIREALRRFGDFHALYHVAGGSGRRMGDGPLHEITDDGWKLTLDENLTSLFYSNRAAAACFLERNTPGSVLNMGSVLGFSPSPTHFSTHAYATAKAAVIGLTKAAASCYASKNIRFNVLAPALVETPMAQRAVHDAEIMQFIASKQPLDGGRVGKPSDLDSAAVFFLSDESKFVTGQVLAVDGGWCLSDGHK